MRKVYIIDSIQLFIPQLDDNWEVYNYSEIEHLSRPLQNVDVVVFLTGDVHSVWGITRKMSLIYAFLSPRMVILKDDATEKKFSKLDLIIKLYQRELQQGNELKIHNAVKEQIGQLDCKKKVKYKNVGDCPMYIKTTLNFGVQSGGAVAHSTGVLSALKEKYDCLDIYTTDYLPDNIKNNTNYNHISMKGFWDMSDLGRLYFSQTAYNDILRLQGRKIPRFVYQRYEVYDYLGLRISKHFEVPFVLEYNSSAIWTRIHWSGEKSLKYYDFAEKIEMLNLRHADIIVCISEESRDTLIERGIDSRKILVNYNGVNTDKYNPWITGKKIRKKYNLEDDIVIGFCGSFGPFHGAEKLAESFSELLQQNEQYRRNVRLLMIGEGITLPKVQGILRTNKVSNEAFCIGSVPFEEMPEYLAACDILVAPHVRNEDGSEFFGSPTKLFEYMAMGKAIAAADLNQIGKILTNEKDALLFEPGDIDALKRNLVRLIDDSNLRAKLGNNARQTVERKYTWNKHVEKILARIEQLYMQPIKGV